jgi:hypothetical protein
MKGVEEVRPLSSVAIEVLASLLHHRVLSTHQVHAMHTLDASRRWAQRIFADLEGRG